MMKEIKGQKGAAGLHLIFITYLLLLVSYNFLQPTQHSREQQQATAAGTRYQRTNLAKEECQQQRELLLQETRTYPSTDAITSIKDSGAFPHREVCRKYLS